MNLGERKKGCKILGTYVAKYDSDDDDYSEVYGILVQILPKEGTVNG